MSVYARFGLVFDAQNVLETIPFDYKSSSLLWSCILRANVSHAIKLYVKMRKWGVLGDGFTFPLVIRTCKFLGIFGSGKIVRNHVLQMGFQENLRIVNELIGMYAKMRRMNDSCKIFDKMRVWSYISWNTIASGFVLSYDCDVALEMFKGMEFEGFGPNLVTWTSLLSSHAQCGRLEETMDLFDMMRTGGVGANAGVLAMLLSVCADLVDVEKAEVIHGHVKKGGLEDYLFVKYALIICVYGNHGD